MSNIKISEMAEAESLNDNDLFTIVQSGVNKKITKQNAIGDIIQAINNPTYTTTEGTNLSINNTRVGQMKWEIKGNIEQDSYNGENLFDKDNPNILNNCVTGSGLTLDTAEGCKTLYIPCKPNLTYTITKVASTRFIVVTTTNTPAIGVATSTRTIDLTGTSITITTGATANYLCVFYYYSLQDTLTEQEILNSIYIKIDTPLPNPDYPQEVKTVTGENTIDILGKNICPDTFSKYNVFSPYTQYNLPIKVGTECIMSFTDNDTNIDISGCYIGFKDSGTGAPTSIRWCINNGSVLSNTTNIPSTGTDWCGTICISPNTEEAFNKLFGRYKIQVEIGNTISNYKSYKEGQSYELNLGANLFDIQKAWITDKTENVSNGLSYTLQPNNEVYINGTPTNFSGVYGRAYNETNTYLLAKANHTYRVVMEVDEMINTNEVRFATGSTSTNQWLMKVYSKGIHYEDHTPTTDLNLAQFSFTGAVASSSNQVTVKMKVAIYDITNIEITNYQPYFTPIQLCKIGNYQDYIHDNGGKWFKHKEVKKQVFNGSETWTTRSVSAGQLYETSVTGFYSTTTQTLGFCNQYKANINLTNNYDFRILSGIVLGLHNDNIGSVANLTTFLASNNMEVYYPLGTPIEEEITEPTLINQLNAIKYGAESYYGTTNIMITSEELQPTLKVQTLDKIGV